VQGHGEVYYIAQSDGIYSYTYYPNFLNLIVPGVVATELRYDDDRHVLLAAVGNSIVEYSLAGNVLATHQLSDSVVSFDVHYTK
jgi:ubiquitin C-terminal hydrolase